MSSRGRGEFSHFLRGLAQLSGGAAAGQLLVVVSAPLLAWLYTPEAFGIFGIVSAVAAILGVIVCLRYELVIPLAPRDEDAATLVAACQLLGLGVVGVLAGLFAVWHLLTVVDAPVPSFLPHLWWLVPAMAFWSAALPLHYEMLRRRAYRTTGVNRLLQFLSQVVGQIGLGVLVGGAGGLVAGYIVGYVVRWLHYWRTSPVLAWWRLGRYGLSRCWPILVAYRRHGLFLAPAALLQALSQAAPILLMAVFQPIASVGAFTLAYKVLDFPSRFLASTASSVFLRELAGIRGDNQKQFFAKVAVLFFVMSLLIFGSVAIVAPYVAVMVFGSAWADSGNMARYLALLQIVKNTVVPVSQAVTVLGRPEIYMFNSLLQLIGVGGAFLTAAWLGLDALATTMVYAAVSAGCWALFLLKSWNAVRRAAQREQRPVDGSASLQLADP
jgi:O-antigen/teichoic acid export membrane protein